MMCSKKTKETPSDVIEGGTWEKVTTENNKRKAGTPDHASNVIHRTLAVKMLEIAIESGATYGEIRRACYEFLEFLENGTKPEFACNVYGERDI